MPKWSRSHHKKSHALTFGKLARFLWPFVRTEKLQLALVIGLVLTQAALARCVTIVLGRAIDQGIALKIEDVLFSSAALYLLFELGQITSQYFAQTLFAGLGNRVVHRLRVSLMHHVQRLPIQYFENNSSGRISTRLVTDTGAVAELFNQGLMPLLSSVVNLAAIAIGMMLISIQLTVITMAVALPLLFFAKALARKVYAANRVAKRRVSILNSFLAETITGSRVIEIFGLSQRQMRLFETHSDRYYQDNMKMLSLYALLFPTISLLSSLAVVAALFAGGWQVSVGGLSVGLMVAFVFMVRDFGDPLRNILERYQVIQNSLSASERVLTLFQEQTERDVNDLDRPQASSRIEPSAVAARPSSPFVHLDFHDISFRYPGRTNWALRNISFQIEKGQRVALVGRTGSGKSTLISLVHRLRDPDSGTIRFNGQRLTEIPLDQLRKRIGVIHQDPFCFRGTLRENIRLHDDTIDDTQILTLMKQTGLDQFIEYRGCGLDLWIEERGANLSQGERQLIAFARVLAFNPELVILDEATANIDPETEAQLSRALDAAAKDRSVLVIAHRLKTVENADQVIVMSEGKVIEQGPPSDLLQQTSSSFHKTWSDHQADQVGVE